MSHAFDSKALALSRQVMGLIETPMHEAQLQAKIQNLFIDAMKFAAPAVQAEQLSGNTEQVSQPDVIDANLVEALRLVQCMLEDYREQNYGDAERWIRHINDLMSDYSEAHGDDAYSVLHGLLPAAPKQEAE